MLTIAVSRAQFATILTGFFPNAYETFFAGLDAMEERLEQQRFLFGDYVTDSDIRLYMSHKHRKKPVRIVRTVLCKQHC